MNIKKFITIFLVIITVLMISNVSYAVRQFFNLNTINIINVNSNSNIYILLNNDSNYDNKGFYEYTLNELIKKMDKSAVNIVREYNNNKLPKQLEDTNQIVTIDGIEYKKIKVLKDITITWDENKTKDSDNSTLPKNVLIANIVNNQINLIDTSNISVETYNDNSVEGYSGNSINRKAMIYDTSKNKLQDITQSKVDEEMQIANDLLERKKMKSKIEGIIAIIIFFAVFIFVPILAGLITEKIVKKRKKA